MRFRLALLLALLASLSAAAALALPLSGGQAESACQLAGGFAQLQAQIPERVGTCSGPDVDQPELGEVTQATANGQLVYRTLDGIVSFGESAESAESNRRNGLTGSSGSGDQASTWVLDPNGQVHLRGMDERFPWEFNGDGFPVVGAGQSGPQTNGPCPTPPVQVLAVENFYANLVNQIGGQCVQTTAILSDPDADPHEFQMNARDVRAYLGAQLVVENGLGYDDFSDKILSTLVTRPALVNAGDVVGLRVGANPHVWYSAGYVDRIRAAILANLKTLDPQASAYFDAQSAALDQAFATYHGLINDIASDYGGTPVGATESIFVDMAHTVGLNVITPPEFMDAVSQGNDPSARDMAMLQNQITNHQIKVLVYNTQTVNSLTEQLKALAHQNNIPVVGVSETMPLGAQTFQGWQAAELELVLQALQQAST